MILDIFSKLSDSDFVNLWNHEEWKVLVGFIVESIVLASQFETSNSDTNLVSKRKYWLLYSLCQLSNLSCCAKMFSQINASWT